MHAHSYTILFFHADSDTILFSARTVLYYSHTSLNNYFICTHTHTQSFFFHADSNMILFFARTFRHSYILHILLHKLHTRSNIFSFVFILWYNLFFPHTLRHNSFPYTTNTPSQFCSFHVHSENPILCTHTHTRFTHTYPNNSCVCTHAPALFYSFHFILVRCQPPISYSLFNCNSPSFLHSPKHLFLNQLRISIYILSNLLLKLAFSASSLVPNNSFLLIAAFTSSFPQFLTFNPPSLIHYLYLLIHPPNSLTLHRARWLSERPRLILLTTPTSLT